MAIKRVNRGRNHSYTIDGRKAEGVTTVIGEAYPKPWMGPWMAKSISTAVVDMTVEDWRDLMGLGRQGAIDQLKRIPYGERDKAAARGTAVHNIAEKIIDGTEVAVPDHLYGHVESCVAFLDEWRVHPVLVEKSVGSYRYGYAGTFDLIADLPDGRRILFDYKTSSRISPTTALQLSAYRNADVWITGHGDELPVKALGITDAMAVHIRADGYDVYPLETGPDVFQAFLHTLALAQAFREEDTWVGVPQSAPTWSNAA